MLGPSNGTPKRDNVRVDAGIGVLAGLASGLLGVGGGIIMVPLQVVWSRSDLRRASGTSLAAIIPIAIGGAAIYYFGRATPQVDLPVALFLVLGSAAGAFVGAHTSQKIPETALKSLVAVMLVGIGMKELYDAVLGNSVAVPNPGLNSFSPIRYAMITGSGFAVGILSGLTGVGGGIFMVPIMVLGFGLAQRTAQGTSLLAIMPTAIVGAITHYGHGNVKVRSALWMAGVGGPAALLGAAIALWLPQRTLAGLFGLFLLIASIRMWPWRKKSSGSTAQ